jgi:hypothetical protein
MKVAVAIALMTIGRAQAQPYILGLLAMLAMVGLFSLFAYAAGIIRFADRTADKRCASGVCVDKCLGLTCPTNQRCVTGACVDSCTGTACACATDPETTPAGGSMSLALGVSNENGSTLPSVSALNKGHFTVVRDPVRCYWSPDGCATRSCSSISSAPS